MSKTVRGFHDDEVSRRLLQRQQIEGDITCVENVDIEADMTFDSASLEFEEKTFRPYVSLRDGHITAVNGELPFGVTKCVFSNKSAPDIELKWNLTNDEIKQLIDKGLYGFDKTYKKRKNEFELPAIFTNVQWVGIPLKADVFGIETELEDGTKVPIMSIDINEPYSQETNSIDTGYDNIVVYFDEPQFYEENPVENKNGYFFELNDNEIIKDSEQVDKHEDNIVHTIEVLSPSEQEEQQIRGELYQQVRENIEAVKSQNKVDDMARIDENLDIENILESETDEPTVAEFEPYTEAELEDLHIVGRKDEEHKAAKAKLSALMRQEMENAARKAMIEEAMAQGEVALLREEMEKKQDSEIGTNGSFGR